MASHLPWLEGHPTSPPAGPGSERGSQTSPPPSSMHGAHWMVPLLNCGQLEPGPRLLLLPGAAPGSPAQVTFLWTLEEPGWTAGRPSRLSGIPSGRRPRADALGRTSSPGDHSLSPRPLADAVCEGSLALHSLLTPAPSHSLGAPRGKTAWWGMHLAQPWRVQAGPAWSHTRPASGLTASPGDGPQVAV